MQLWPLKVLGISYKSAPIQLREHFSYEANECAQLLLQLRDTCAIEEAMLLSTCNRTEIYYVSEKDCSQDLYALLCISKATADQYQKLFYRKNTTEEAIAHLFSVALGIDAQVLGDQQVLHQVKRSYKLSTELQLALPCLHRLMHTIFYSHKRIAKETSWCSGTASVAYAAVELLRSLLRGHKKVRVLLLGLGEIGKDIGRNLQHLPASHVYVANRTYRKAATLAKNYGYEAIPFSEYKAYLEEVEIIISCASQAAPLVAKDMLRQRKLPCQYLLDLAVPRSIESSVAELPGILLYNIDEIRETTSRTLAKRQAALPEVVKIAKDAQNEFLSWCQAHTFSPVIHRLKELLEQLRKEEMASHLKSLSNKEIEKVDKITRSLLQRIIKYPVLRLKAACKKGEADTLADLLVDLFDLEKSTSQSKSKA